MFYSRIERVLQFVRKCLFAAAAASLDLLSASFDKCGVRFFFKHDVVQLTNIHDEETFFPLDSVTSSKLRLGLLLSWNFHMLNRRFIPLQRQQVSQSQFHLEIKSVHDSQMIQNELIKLIVEENCRGLTTPSGDSPYLKVRTLLMNTVNMLDDVMRNISMIHKNSVNTQGWNPDKERDEVEFKVYGNFWMNNMNQRGELVQYIQRGLFLEMVQVRGIVRGVLDDCPNDTCPICMGEELDEKLNVAILDSCRHLFCARCFKDWFEIRKHCPMCRQPVLQWASSETVRDN